MKLRKIGLLMLTAVFITGQGVYAQETESSERTEQPEKMESSERTERPEEIELFEKAGETERTKQAEDDCGR